MDLTNADPPARLLDLTRLISRAGRAQTGVDRVEYAYLSHLLSQATPLYGLVRTRLGFVLLDRAGCAAIRDRLRDDDWGAPDLLARLSRKADPVRLRAEADLRRVAAARCLPRGLGRMLRRHLPAGTHYLNTGHSNLSDRVITAVRAIPQSRIAVLIHDTIPLDHPQFQRPGSVDRFRHFLTRVGRAADLLICNTAQTRADIARHLGADGLPQTVVAHLGVPRPVPGTAPAGPWTGQPYFVCLGTIEPRKNHALLLDLWPDIPEAHLLICGHRGWENHAVFARLDAGQDRVHELNGLPDEAIFALLRDSAGLLFPSLAEGYGLPPIEAAALGRPVVCNDLPIYREVLGDIPIYAEVSDGYLWRTKIIELAKDHAAGKRPSQHKGGFTPPDWDAHFKTVLRLI
ncbi:glycosyltransferase family 1 protein [Aestuariicoccus sp. MJ-SS9]|uniref:glycosyltransferase family 4 protein n=1 Tax=Aestuariicoccus sp. MJ-SS9 TaxID=3079855 RepID=UPI002915449F|nr:glycosyltransferase family 1 protein [Aestuariicoccus sp. MJ-SS9]MDU8910190.1 glycosyltransferase family 1 protein [Aestuariicoccus sp. MJ-SS9]